MNNKIILHNCGREDVLSFGSAMLKVSNLLEELEKFFHQYKLGKQISDSCHANKLIIPVRREFNGRSSSMIEHYEEWFDNGIACETLKIGAKGWQRGKIKINLQISLEFYPDLPEINNELDEVQDVKSESPLDDIRQKINQVN
ncbi:KGK domain-containing protein [Gloeocapsopsis sp. IPPAS B-1203]|uniref:KGK domain-containing protein n=1 Tax=Gloeocapsopsis sp. IPPAS B-1203 TaxID=2049454 RepID=UPI000C1A533A|nr:KGK domain-containing protein [Gloeocapsopsis sp. IPPAS B-1203]PIG91763.1 hypothetical protein CSQ79_19680 [Gloeocapsopsis sp. IPPAS B-1203]